MSINSIFKTMSTADKLSIPNIVSGVRNGSIPSYVGVPLIEKKTKDAQKLQMAQAIMRQLEGGPPSTVNDQVMQAADQVTRPENPLAPTSLATDRQRPAPSMGIDAAQSNMPQEYAGGGIVAFAKGGSPDEEVNPLTDITALMGPSNWPITPYYKKLAAYPGAVEEAGMSPSMLYQLITGKRSRPDTEFAPEDSPIEVADVGRQAPMTPPQAQPPATPAGPAATPPAAGPDISITRGPEAAPPSAPPQAPQESAFSGIEDLYKSYLDRGKADRDELRSLILGQKADRAEQEAENRNVALMKAGFGMMAGQSPFAGVNIGRGAMEGAESYAKGLEQLRRDDRATVQQLASLGLKGQELDQAAMKMGIDLSHYKMQEPYMQAMTEQHRAEAGLAPLRGGLLSAQAGLTKEQAAQTATETGLLPLKAEIDKIKAYAQSHKAAGYKPPSDKYISTIQDQAEAALADPLNSGLPLNQETIIALTKTPKGSTSYNNALREVQQLALERARFKMAQRGMWAGQGSGGGIAEEE